MNGHGELFDPIALLTKPLPRHAHVRNMIGEIAARFAVEAMEATALPIRQNQTVCPDFELAGLHGEIKSVGKNRRALLYKWRVEKEATAFTAEGYLYLFVLHNCPITCKDISEITAYFRDDYVEMVGCTLAELQTIVQNTEPRKFSMFRADSDPRIGYNRAGYCEGGWQFGTKLLPAPAMRMRLGVPWLGTIKATHLNLSSGWINARMKSISK